MKYYLVWGCKDSKGNLFLGEPEMKEAGKPIPIPKGVTDIIILPEIEAEEGQTYPQAWG